MRDGETRRKKVEWKKAKQKMNDNWLEKVSEEIEKKKKKKAQIFLHHDVCVPQSFLPSMKKNIITYKK